MKGLIDQGFFNRVRPADLVTRAKKKKEKRKEKLSELMTRRNQGEKKCGAKDEKKTMD